MTAGHGAAACWNRHPLRDRPEGVRKSPSLAPLGVLLGWLAAASCVADGDRQSPLLLRGDDGGSPLAVLSAQPLEELVLADTGDGTVSRSRWRNWCWPTREPAPWR